MAKRKSPVRVSGSVRTGTFDTGPSTRANQPKRATLVVGPNAGSKSPRRGRLTVRPYASVDVQEGAKPNYRAGVRLRLPFSRGVLLETKET